MTEQEYQAALDAIEAQMARDYLAEAAKITRNVTLSEVLASIERGNAILQRDIFNSRYGKLAEDVRAAYLAGGQAEAANIPRKVLGRPAEFDITRPRAREWVAAAQSDLVTGIARAQGEAIQAVIASGQQLDISPPQIARNLLGVSTAAGDRVGGVVGLTGQDVEWLNNTRVQLSSGDPSLMRDYFLRVRRDKRYDGIVQRAIDARQPVAPDDIAKITQRYAERLLVTRADTVASIEAMGAYNAGRAELYAQMVDDGIDPAAIFKRWKSRGDEKVRASHRQMNGQKVPGAQPFITPRGARMMHPGDTSMGAPLSEVARCRCRAIYNVVGED